MPANETDIIPPKGRLHFIGFDGEKAITSDATLAQIREVKALRCALVDLDTGEPLDWHVLDIPDQPASLFPFIVRDRRLRVDQKTAMADRPPIAVLTEYDGAIVRLEFYEGHDQLVCTYDLRSKELVGKELPRWMDRDPLAYDPVAFLEQALGMPPEFTRPLLQATHDPSMPGLADSYRSDPGQQLANRPDPDDPTIPSNWPDEVTAENASAYKANPETGKSIRVIRLKARGFTACGDLFHDSRPMEDIIASMARVISEDSAYGPYLTEIHYDIDGELRWCYVQNYASIDDWGQGCWTRTIA